MNLKARFNQLETLLTSVGAFLFPVVLLVMRLFWGWQFFQTGKGKLMNLDRTAGYFASIDIPLPKLNAFMAGLTEAGGGLLLALGLASRLASFPLIVVMFVAYATADREALMAAFSDPDRFTSAAPFLFLLTCVIIFSAGPGKYSLDAWLKRPGAGK
ncbi:MAG: inner membrane protein YphA [Verrucomicrobiota bacterium]|jgi:putative oxidoreductase